MIRNIIDLLNASDWYGISENVDIAKGKYKAPKNIDYLSIDTEGNEFEILKNLDFTIYKPSIISIEHNHDSKIKESIFDLLNEHGYIKIFKEISDQDDWYKLKNL